MRVHDEILLFEGENYFIGFHHIACCISSVLHKFSFVDYSENSLNFFDKTHYIHVKKFKYERKQFAITENQTSSDNLKMVDMLGKKQSH